MLNNTRRDTLRPVKRLDTAGSLRLSEEFVGASGTGKAGSSHSGGSGGSVTLLDTTEESASRKKSRSGRSKKAKSKPSAGAVAGRSMVSEVIIPNLEKVSPRTAPLGSIVSLTTCNP